MHKLLDELVGLLTKAALHVHSDQWLVGLTGGVVMLLNHGVPSIQVFASADGTHAVVIVTEQPGHRADGVAEGMGEEEWLEGIWNGVDMRDSDVLRASLMTADVFQARERHI